MRSTNIRPIHILVVVFLLVFGALHSAFAQAGALDLSFNSKGYSVEALTGGGNAYGSAIQPDGKIVQVGFGSYGGVATGFSAVRYNPDGSLDTTFGKAGRTLTSFGATLYSAPGVVRSDAKAVAIQPDGKIVLTGSVQYRLEENSSIYSEIALVRYNADGSLDPSFDGDGKVRTFLGRSAHQSGNAIAMTAGGKIVVAGGDSLGMEVIRYNSDGSLDETFDGDGIRLYPSGRFASAMVIQPDGKIVVTGQGAGGSFETVRFNVDGTLDTSFNGTGVAPVPASAGQNYPQSLLLQPDGRIIVGGGWNSAYTALMRYNPDGTFDNSFGTDGFAYFNGNMTYYGGRVAALQPDGKIVIAGQIERGTYQDPNRGFKIIRLNSNGSFDTTFNGTGFVITPVGKSNDNPTGVMVLPAGEIVVTGFLENSAAPFAVVRYESDGSLDQTFGSGGKVFTEIGYGGVEANDVELQNDGKIVAAGGSYGAFAIARYNPNGATDQTFNSAGTVRALQGRDSVAYAVAVQADGRIVAAGKTRGSIKDEAALVRFNADGSADNTFGLQGEVITSLGPGHDTLVAMAVQPDGKIVAAGRAGFINGSGSDFALVRYNSDGSLDTAFGGDGKVIGHPCADPYTSLASLVVQPDGKITASGFCDGLTVFRFNSDGSADTSFNKTGRVTKSESYGDYSDVKIQADNKIVVSSNLYGGDDFLVVRYNPDGSLDTSFNGSGMASRSVGTDREVATSLVIQPDGKIILGGL